MDCLEILCSARVKGFNITMHPLCLLYAVNNV